jgi:hypothetical protein
MVNGAAPTLTPTVDVVVQTATETTPEEEEDGRGAAEGLPDTGEAR